MSANELRDAYSGLRKLSNEGSTDGARWDAAIAAFSSAVQRCDDAAALEAVLADDTHDELPVASKTRAYERRLEIGPRTPALLRQYADHLWLHGPAADDKVEALNTEADVIEETTEAMANTEVETVWHFRTQATFEATRELVFQALTEAPHLQSWLAGTEQTVELGIDDGARTVRLEAAATDATACHVEARFTSLLAPRELTADLSWRTATWHEPGLRLTLALDATTLTETQLTIDIHGFRRDDPVGEARDRVDDVLDRLGRHLAPRADDALDQLVRTAPVTGYADLDESLLLEAAEGAPVRAQAQRVAWTTVEGQPVECRLRLTVSPDEYADIEQRALFHLETDARKTPFGGSFEPTESVRIDLQLDPDQLSELATRADSAESVAALLLGDSAAPLLAADSWFALAVSQPQGPVRVGYQTSWADTLRAKRPLIGVHDR